MNQPAHVPESHKFRDLYQAAVDSRDSGSDSPDPGLELHEYLASFLAASDVQFIDSACQTTNRSTSNGRIVLVAKEAVYQIAFSEISRQPLSRQHTVNPKIEVSMHALESVEGMKWTYHVNAGKLSPGDVTITADGWTLSLPLAAVWKDQADYLSGLRSALTIG